MQCLFCEKEVEPARAELELTVCLKCAKEGYGQERVHGVMTYEHKTGGEIQLMRGREKFLAFKNYVRCQGRGGGFNSATGKLANKIAAAKIDPEKDEHDIDELMA